MSAQTGQASSRQVKISRRVRTRLNVRALSLVHAVEIFLPATNLQLVRNWSDENMWTVHGWSFKYEVCRFVKNIRGTNIFPVTAKQRYIFRWIFRYMLFSHTYTLMLFLLSSPCGCCAFSAEYEYRLRTLVYMDQVKINTGGWVPLIIKEYLTQRNANTQWCGTGIYQAAAAHTELVSTVCCWFCLPLGFVNSERNTEYHHACALKRSLLIWKVRHQSCCCDSAAAAEYLRSLSLWVQLEVSVWNETVLLSAMK